MGEVEVRLAKEQKVNLAQTDLGNGVHGLSGKTSQVSIQVNVEKDT